jgi:hypothetical protein
MTKLQEIVSKLTDSDLNEAFFDFESYNEKGILAEDSIIRMVRARVASDWQGDSWDITCMFTSIAILHEIAKRHFSEIRGNKQ